MNKVQLKVLLINDTNRGIDFGKSGLETTCANFLNFLVIFPRLGINYCKICSEGMKQEVT
jgi:hypothetical protein